MKKSTKSKIEFFFFKFFINIFKVLPYNFTRSFLAKLFVFGAGIFNIRKSLANEQLKMVFPDKSDKEIKNIIKKMYYHMGLTTAESYFGNKEKLFKTCKVQGWENLKNAVRKGKGVILATGHFGNWELAGKYIAAHFDLAVVGKRQRNRYFDDYTNALRLKDKVIVINKKNALRPILKMLGEGYIVSLLMDQNAGRNGVLTDFLGHDASTFVGAAKIAIKTGCPIAPAYAIREDDGSHLFLCEEIISPEGFKNNLEDITKFTEIISKRIEKYIYQYPHLWFWVHKRWKGHKKARKI
ncbi:MAG: lysophospholipid acyltransferase family protein [Candidatus Cloacimonadota bacterium]|nr:lysophospholipid acyltransferase family protein [Candidatus Cloacimonadota bacterium]